MTERLFRRVVVPRSRWRRAALGAAGVLIATAAALSAQATDERRLWDTEFRQKRQTTRPASAAPVRPPAAGPARPPAAAAPPQPSPVYTRADAAPTTLPIAGEMLGITVWRLRTPRTTDAPDSRLLIQEDGPAEWTPERVELGTSFTAGDRVRLSIESPRTGFLYVLDRELYDDGSTSDPYLIFPTLRMRGGDNAVAAGRVIELPQGSAFRLQPMRSGYSGELLTLLVTTSPLAGVSPAAGIQKLERATFDTWERQWRTQVERFEMVGGAGRSYAKGDREAAVDARLLTQDDPLPQTLLRVAANPGQPLMIDVALRITK